jgi:hypothetical protein
MKVILLALAVPVAFSIAWGTALRLIHNHSAKAHLAHKGTTH